MIYGTLQILALVTSVCCMLFIPQRSSWNAPKREECAVCGKVVYVMERLEADKVVYHKTCFKCTVCTKTLRLVLALSLSLALTCSLSLSVFFITPHSHPSPSLLTLNSYFKSPPPPLPLSYHPEPLLKMPPPPQYTHTTVLVPMLLFKARSTAKFTSSSCLR